MNLAFSVLFLATIAAPITVMAQSLPDLPRRTVSDIRREAIRPSIAEMVRQGLTAEAQSDIASANPDAYPEMVSPANADDTISDEEESSPEGQEPAENSPEYNNPPGASIPAIGQLFIGEGVALDGDTISLAGQTIRLEGADAPESGQFCRVKGLEWRCGQKARERLAELLRGKKVRCVTTGVIGSVLVAQCQTGEADIGSAMVRDGLAIVPPAGPPTYKAMELAARNFQRGVWSGTFVPPWEWRKRASSLLQPVQ